LPIASVAGQCAPSLNAASCLLPSSANALELQRRFSAAGKSHSVTSLFLFASWRVSFIYLSVAVCSPKGGSHDEPVAIGGLPNSANACAFSAGKVSWAFGRRPRSLSSEGVSYTELAIFYYYYSYPTSSAPCGIPSSDVSSKSSPTRSSSLLTSSSIDLSS